MKSFFTSFLLLALLLSTSCGRDKRQQEIRKLNIPAFNSERAYENIRSQVAFGPRVVGHEGREKALNWIVSSLKSYGFQVHKQSFSADLYTGRSVRGTNIIASHNRDVIERLLLGAHWDSRPFADKDTVRTDQPIPGADDGASGVGVLLEVARLVKEKNLPMGIDIVFFDLQDYGDPTGNDVDSWGLGSQFWAQKANKKGYRARYGIFLDMVGAQNAQFTIEGLSAAVSSKIVTKIWTLAAGMGQQAFFVPRRTKQIIGDHRFVFEKTALPVVNIANHGQGKTFADHHHTHRDDMGIISKETLKAVGQVVTAVVFKESNMEF